MTTVLVPQSASKRGPLSQLKEFTACASDLGRNPREVGAILWRLSKNVRVRFGLGSYHPDRVFALPTRYSTVFLRDNFGDVTNLPGLFHRCEYGVTKISGEGAILDIGANIGLFAAWMAFHNPDKRIYCFEPLASNVRMISLNCPRATVMQLGVGKERSSVKLRVDPHGIMATSVATRWPTAEEEFQVRPLDELVREHNIGRIAFLKVDTEGMELDILDGAKAALAQTQACALETHGTERHEGVMERLRAAGFTVTRAEFDGNTGLVFAARNA